MESNSKYCSLHVKSTEPVQVSKALAGGEYRGERRLKCHNPIMCVCLPLSNNTWVMAVSFRFKPQAVSACTTPNHAPVLKGYRPVRKAVRGAHYLSIVVCHDDTVLDMKMRLKSCSLYSNEFKPCHPLTRKWYAMNFHHPFGWKFPILHFVLLVHSLTIVL